MAPITPTSDLARQAAERTLGQTIWLTGLSGAGKTTIAQAIEQELGRMTVAATVLDGDVLRSGLSSDLGLSARDRSEQARRAAHVAALFAQTGLVAIVALISPYAADRSRAREIHVEAGLPFCEVWVDTPLRVCAERDPKGLYARREAGLLRGLTGVDDPYEDPEAPEVHVVGYDATPQAAALQVLDVAMHGAAEAPVSVMVGRA